LPGAPFDYRVSGVICLSAPSRREIPLETDTAQIW